MSLLKDLKHANIVTLHDIVHTDKSLTLVFEYLVRLRVDLLNDRETKKEKMGEFCVNGLSVYRPFVHVRPV